MEKIQMLSKEVYGKVLLYPDCEKSKLFANLTNTKTLSLTQLRDIHDLGFEIEIKRINGKIIKL